MGTANTFKFGDSFDLSSVSDNYSDNDDMENDITKLNMASFLNQSSISSGPKKKSCFMIHPDNRFKRVWDLYIVVLLVINFKNFNFRPM